MDLERKHFCPLLKKKCIQLDCEWYIKLEGEDPQDPKRYIESWGCAVPWIVSTGLQVAKDVRKGTDGIQKATESFRNEVVDTNMTLINRIGQSVLRLSNGRR